MIEKDAWYVNGYVGILVLTVLTMVAILSVNETEYWLAMICIAIGVILSTGLVFVQPNQAMIIQFLGKYTGTYRNAGLVMVTPFSIKKRISLRTKAYHTDEVTIYDNTQHAYTVSLMLIYRIVDAAKAVYDIEDMEAYIDLQCEMVWRRYLSNTELKHIMEKEEIFTETNSIIQDQLIARLENAGIELLELQLLIIPKYHLQHKINSEILLSELKQLIKKDLPSNRNKYSS